MVLEGHQNVIDCVKFAPKEAAKTIENADYNK